MKTLKQIFEEKSESKKIKSQADMIDDMDRHLDAIAVYDKDGTNAPGTKLYKKSGTFDARKAKVGEHIVTTIDGEDETKKTAKADEVVVKGPKGELYVVSTKKFNERYEVTKPLTDKFQKYKAKGLIRAYEYKGPTFKFMASWDEEMLCKEGDYLACPVLDADESKAKEVYRIEKSVFAETYTLADEEAERKKAEWNGCLNCLRSSASLQRKC